MSKGTISAYHKTLALPIRVAALSKSCVCGRTLSGIAGSKPAGNSISVTCECCELLGRGLCAGPITPPEESYRV